MSTSELSARLAVAALKIVASQGRDGSVENSSVNRSAMSHASKQSMTRGKAIKELLKMRRTSA